MTLTRFLVDELRKREGLTIAAEPVTNIVGLVPLRQPVSALARGLRSRGWAVSEYPGHIRIVLLPHLSRNHIEAFLQDLDQLT
jgi:tyrosine decarboxylase/aspartate 1-decarboxylase